MDEIDEVVIWRYLENKFCLDFYFNLFKSKQPSLLTCVCMLPSATNQNTLKLFLRIIILFLKLN